MMLANQENLDKRPISPYLSIYKLQLTSGLSILHRITGAYLYLGIIALSWLIFLAVYFPHLVIELNEWIMQCRVTRILSMFSLFIWTFALIYHQLNGIRHLLWDMGKGFDLKVVYITGKLVLALAILLTIICWVLA